MSADVAAAAGASAWPIRSRMAGRIGRAGMSPAGNHRASLVSTWSPPGLPLSGRDLVLAVDQSLFPQIQGTADTEVLFCLALTFGLEDDPPDAVARAIGLVEACGQARGVQYPFQGTIATTDGESLWAFRYSSQGKSRSLFFTRTFAC